MAAHYSASSARSISDVLMWTDLFLRRRGARCRFGGFGNIARLVIHAVPRTHGQFLDLRRHNDAIQMIGLAIELDRGADVKAKVRR